MKIALRKYKQRPTLLDEADFTVVESHQNYNYIELLPVLVSLDASYLKCCKKGSKHTSYKSFVMTPSVRGLYMYFISTTEMKMTSIIPTNKAGNRL